MIVTNAVGIAAIAGSAAIIAVGTARIIVDMIGRTTAVGTGHIIAVGTVDMIARATIVRIITGQATRRSSSICNQARCGNMNKAPSSQDGGAFLCDLLFEGNFRQPVEWLWAWPLLEKAIKSIRGGPIVKIWGIQLHGQYNPLRRRKS